MADLRLEPQVETAEQALGSAIREIRVRKGLTVNEVVQNTQTYFDDWTVERIERGEEEDTFLGLPSIVRLVVEGLKVEVSEVIELMLPKLVGQKEAEGKSPPRRTQADPQPSVTAHLGMGSLPPILAGLDLRSESVANFYDTANELPDELAALMAAPAAPLHEHPEIPEAPGIYLLSTQAAEWNDGHFGTELAHEGERRVMTRVTRNLAQKLDEELVRPDRNDPNSLLMSMALKDREQDFYLDKEPKPLEQLLANESFQASLTRARDRIANLDVRFVLDNDLTQLRLLAIYVELLLDTMIYNNFEYAWRWTIT
jgi:hypothetical protein